MASKRRIPALSCVALCLAGVANAADERALVVADKQCTRLVQPYKISDNIGSVITGTTKSLASGLKARLTGGGNEGVLDAARLQAKRSNWLPMKTEVMYGERLHAQETGILARDSKIGKKVYPVADQMLEQYGQKIGEPHEYMFRLFILKNATRNAMARPGGFLYLDQGLLDDPKLLPKARFALAHELAHVLQRHETRELQGMIVDTFDSTRDIKDAVLHTKDNPGGVLDKLKINKDSYTKHHVDQELQADSCAVRLLGNVYPDRKQVAAILDTFLKDLPAPDAPASAASAGDTQLTALAATAHDIVATPAKRHPNTQERADNLRAMYTELNTVKVE